MRALWRRHSGQVLLLAVALALLAGWRVRLAQSLPESHGGETAGVAGSLPVSSVSGDVAAPESFYSQAELPVITDHSLAPAPQPHTFTGRRPEHHFQTHVVKRGETPGSIAEQYGIKPETLLGGNPQLSQESNLLQVGVTLIILPEDGVLHEVQPGETLADLAALYGIPAADIIAYESNNLEFPYRLYPGTDIFVPGAVRELFVWTPPDLSSVTGRTSWEGRGVRPVVVGTGTFQYPVNSRNFTQKFWYGHPAVDIALPEGSPVLAADTGTVTYAGWNNYGYGYLIVVNHGNGYETFYAHLSRIDVVPGQIVTKGQVIGGTGNTGNSSGPHVHFEIRINNNQDDPCWYLGC